MAEQILVMAQAESPSNLSGHAWKVLIVDDEEDIRDSLQDLLEGSLDGVKCVTAEGGDAALDRMEKERFDLIISDFKMPGMDGVDFLVQAGQEAPSTPRILITAFPDLQVAVRAINEAGIENFFTKPLDPEEVLRVVAETLQARDERLQRDRALARALQQVRSAGSGEGPEGRRHG